MVNRQHYLIMKNNNTLYCSCTFYHDVLVALFYTWENRNQELKALVKVAQSTIPRPVQSPDNALSLADICNPEIICKSFPSRSFLLDEFLISRCKKPMLGRFESFPAAVTYSEEKRFFFKKKKSYRSTTS